MNENFGLELLVSHGVEPKGIIHIGAHTGEEATYYRAWVGERVLWVEAHPDYYAILVRNSELGSQLALHGCLSNTTGDTVDFYITADQYASSMLKPEYHQVQNPHAPVTGMIQVETSTFDALVEDLSEADREMYVTGANVLVLDVQGAELMVLEGMGDLGQFEAIATEFSTVEFYADGPRLEDLDDHLGKRGFKRVFLPVDDWGNDLIHGDCLYIRSAE